MSRRSDAYGETKINGQRTGTTADQSADEHRGIPLRVLSAEPAEVREGLSEHQAALVPGNYFVVHDAHTTFYLPCRERSAMKGLRDKYPPPFLFYTLKRKGIYEKHFYT
jgi:hypothetical protein